MSHSQASITTQPTSSRSARFRASRSGLVRTCAPRTRSWTSEVRVAARAVVPVAAVDEDGDLATRIGDVGSAGRLLPVKAVAAEARRPKGAAQAPLGPGVARAIGAHDVANGWARRRRVRQLESGHVPVVPSDAAARSGTRPASAISSIDERSAIRSTTPTTRALPIMNARLSVGHARRSSRQGSR